MASSDYQRTLSLENTILRAGSGEMEGGSERGGREGGGREGGWGGEGGRGRESEERGSQFAKLAPTGPYTHRVT